MGKSEILLLLSIIVCCKGASLIEQDDFKANFLQTNIADSTNTGGAANEYTNCGGVIEALSGVINYKVGEDITDGEICAWYIVAAQKETIQVQLLQDGFTADWTNRIYVYNMSYLSPETGLLITKGDRTVYNIEGGSMIRIVHIDRPRSGEPAAWSQGFSISFQGIGENINLTTWTMPLPKTFDLDGQYTGNLSYYAGPIRTGEFASFYIKPDMAKRIVFTLETLYTGQREDMPYQCGQGGPGTFMAAELGYGTNYVIMHPTSGVPTIRLSECRNRASNIAIISPLPIFVTYWIPAQGSGFTISWRMID